jgi:proline iminopeptidase
VTQSHRVQHQREQFVELPDGTQLRVETSGEGPPVVCCHGGPGLWDYLGDLAALLDGSHLVVRFDQRGCGRSTSPDGPFTVAQAVDDLERLRQAMGLDRWAVLGHSWGAELALRYAAAHPDRTTAVACLAGVGAGAAWRQPYIVERNRRLGAELPRWQQLGSRRRTPDEEKEWCLLQWRPDFSPAGDAEGHAAALWRTRPSGTVVNGRANRELAADSANQDLLEVAQHVEAPVILVQGADDPRPWTATDGLLNAMPQARRIVVEQAGHAPWRERPEEVQAATLEAMTPR